MHKPDRFELKQWLRHHSVVGIEVTYRMTSEDESETLWNLTPFYSTALGQKKPQPKTVRPHTIQDLIEFKPDWRSVLQLRKEFEKEVDEYEAFTAKNQRELAEYERLKRKYG